jgi:hypothetical protein
MVHARMYAYGASHEWNVVRQVYCDCTLTGIDQKQVTPDCMRM